MNHYEVRWQNFKGFRDTGWVKIKPITILLGVNNSGKTNFIAPFLLMNQTINSKDPYSPLIIKGQTYDGGNIQELMNDYNLNKEISFGFRYHVHESNEKLPKIGVHAPGCINFTLSVPNKKRDGDILIKRESVSDVFQRNFFSLSLTKNFKYKLTSPKDYQPKYEDEKKAILNAIPEKFLFTPDSVLSSLSDLDALHEKKVRRRKGYSAGFSNLLDIMSYNYSRIREYIGDLSYIGPLREFPHRVYEISNENYNTVGPKGENMANLLKKHFSKRNKELETWIKRFGFGDWVEIEYLFGNSYSIRFREEVNPEMYTSIANSGFGASQILPLIIQALVSPGGSLTIAEQPEIHLNPRLQCELADLFAFMTMRNQKVIIETHSEYLLLRLRQLVAKGTISANDVAIYFIERTNGISNLREIKLEDNGHINPKDWPQDFFEDSLKESFKLASAQLERKRKDNAK